MRRVVVAVLVATLASGCYTMLRHPAVPPPESNVSDLADRSQYDPQDEEWVGVRAGQCAACHNDWELEQFEYAFHPGYYPSAGPWPGWYCEPWWAQVVETPHGSNPPRGERVREGAGMKNDRGTGSGVAPGAGVWLPPASAPPAEIIQQPVNPTPGRPASGTPNPSQLENDRGRSPHTGGSRTGSGAAVPRASSDVKDPAPVPPGLNDETPGDPGSGTSDGTNPPPTPAGQNDETPAEPGSESSGSSSSSRAADPAPQPKEVAPRPAESSPAPHSDPAPKSDDSKKDAPKQGKGMKNDRPRSGR